MKGSILKKRTLKLLARQGILVQQRLDKEVWEVFVFSESWVQRAADCAVRLIEINIIPHSLLTDTLVESVVEI